MEIELPKAFAHYVACKGSIAVNGISLTVAEVLSKSFVVWIVPYTKAHTNLDRVQVGDPMNLEFDILARYDLKECSVTNTKTKPQWTNDTKFCPQTRIGAKAVPPILSSFAFLRMIPIFSFRVSCLLVVNLPLGRAIFARAALDPEWWAHHVRPLSLILPFE